MKSKIHSVALGIAVALALPACAAHEQAGEAAKWVGKNRAEVVRELGRPSSAVPLVETGGEILIYAHPGQTHYAFETGPAGNVVRAAEIK